MLQVITNKLTRYSLQNSRAAVHTTKATLFTRNTSDRSFRLMLRLAGYHGQVYKNHT